MIKVISKLAFVLYCIGYLITANAVEPLANKAIFDNGYPEAAQTESLVLSFAGLGVSQYKLDGVRRQTYVDFTNRLDKLVKKLTLHFSFSHSPALLSQVSHLKVYFNDNLISALPIDAQNIPIDQIASHSIELNPKLIKDFNQIRFELVGYYDLVCQDNFSKTIWAELSKSSYLGVQQQALALESQLEYFPAPFFDSRDNSQLNLPFIFPSTPDEHTLEAAAALASWFGAEANWRKANFPVQFNKSPSTHSVVFATNDNKPDFLLDYPDVDTPTVEIISSPTERYTKILLILGKDTQQLKDAVVGLLFGHKVMTGRTASIKAIDNLPLRKAYDAPRWVRSDRAVTFAEFIEYPEQLQSAGLQGQPVSLDLRFAPDLFTWREKGIPINLLYRNTPPEKAITSRLTMLINGRFIDGFELPVEKHETRIAETLVPLLAAQNPSKTRQDFTLTGLDLSKKNQLTYDFNFAVVKAGECSAVPAGGEFGAIDGSSTIDISDFNHYIALPDLSVFANSGFPFTKYADLHQTTIMMAQQNSAEAINLLLNFAGHLGEITGYPSHRLSIKFAADNLALKDQDIIIIAKPDSFSTKLIENSSISALLKYNQRIVDQAIYNGTYDTEQPEKIKVSVDSQGLLGVISGFQSPFNNDRSVVSMIATSDNAYPLLSQALINEDRLALIKGSAAIINQRGIKTLQTDEQYFIGHLPVHTLIWFHFSDHPLLLAILSIITLLLISFILWRLLGVLTQKRLSEGAKK
ncbi:cellulose biosynthesis cyclic di-GMP-binding regulatory protein BcsB [Pseudoalteromonas mariniglutinosa]|uniref:cellulose biosynthesis cyclic di-GMP-binding regulatory protein BcsB n=1 Tax=Pseudoalteromonas mariniglutinosa TaxID=206042 RepID=UPI00384B3365